MTTDAVPPRSESDRESFGSGRRLASNTAALVGSRLVVAIFGWTGTVLIARELGQTQFGQFTLVFSILGMLSIVTDLGVGRIAVSGVMSNDDPDARASFAGTYIVLRSLLGIVGYAIAMAVVLALDHPPIVVQATAIGGIVVLLATPAAAYEVAYQVKDRLLPLALSRVVGQLAQLGLTIALVLEGGTLLWFVVPAVLRDLIVVAWVAPGAHRLIGIRYRVDAATWKVLLREAIPLTAGSAFVTLYYRLDSVMLSKLDTFEAVGVYGVAYKFVDLVHFVPLALSTAILAPLTAAWPDQPSRFAGIVANGGRIVVFATVGPAAAFWLFGSELAELLYGAEYAAAGLSSGIVMTAETMGALSALAITTLVAAGRHRVYPFITLGGLVLNVIANLVLIPAMSIEGAAIATLCTEALVVVLLGIQIHRLEIRLVDGRFATAILLAAGLAAAAGLLTEMALGWVAGLVATAGIYLGVAFGTLRPELAALRGRADEEVST